MVVGVVLGDPEQEAHAGRNDGMPRSGPSSILRKALAPLLAYHILILGGAFFVGWGITVGPRADFILGVALIVVGIGVEGAVLAWSASLTMESARTAGRPSSAVGLAPGNPGVGTGLCTGCGWSDSRSRTICPRCGKPLVRWTKVAGGR